jgi:two-component system cell cycle sensor histidine kinase PleC
MFSYIRYFAAIAFVLVIAAAYFVGNQFKEIASKDLIALVSTNSSALAQGFTNTVWKDERAKTVVLLRTYQQFKDSKLPLADWSKYQGYAEMAKGFADLARNVFRYFEEVPHGGVTLYASDGTKLLMINQSKVETFLNSKWPPINEEDESILKLRDAMQGVKNSALVENMTISTPDGSTKTGNMVRTYIPIIAAEYVSVLIANPKGENTKPVEGVLEINFDVTEQSKNLDQFRIIGGGGIMVIFVVVIIMLIIFDNKAQAIITKQHEANVELASQAATAQAESRDKSQFLANVSHELRTPLNAINGFSEIIMNERMGPLGNDKYVEYIKDINNSGTHLLSLINDILDYSKAEADKLELDIGDVDITKAIKNSIRLVIPRAEQAGVTLLDEIPKEHFILKTDQKKLKQVMLNLLSNAVKFTPSGGSVTVTAWQNVVDESVTIEVKDTGIGIAAKDISRAMAPFGQVDSALSRKYEGTGLGLPLTKKFVELMGGTFSIASEVNVGTTITFVLPKEAAARK